MDKGLNLKDDKAEKLKKQRDSEMARSQALKDALNKKTKELQNTLETGEPVRDAGRVLNPDNKKKQTIKSLNIPLNAGTTGTGLNI